MLPFQLHVSPLGSGPRHQSIHGPGRVCLDNPEYASWVALRETLLKEMGKSKLLLEALRPRCNPNTSQLFHLDLTILRMGSLKYLRSYSIRE